MTEQGSGDPRALLERAMRHQRENALAEAESCYLAYLARVPEDAGARAAYAGLLSRQGRLAESIDAYRIALGRNPDFAEAASNLGLALNAAGEHEEAEEWLLHAASLKPGMAAVHLNLGATRQHLGRYDDSALSFERAVHLAPQSAAARYNLGNGYARLYRLDEAIAEYRRAIELEPDFVAARWNLSHVLLLLGRYAEGWEQFESRWRMPSAEAPLVTGRLWSGEGIAGKRLLIWSEQGYGDTLQFVRYAPLAAHLGARVHIRTRPQLVRLLRTLEGVDAVTTSADPVPHFDYQCPVMSLPRAFRATLETIPASIPYLAADRERVGEWRGRLDQKASLRVGLVWSSGVRAYNREVFYAGITKSVTLAQFNPLAAVPRVQFVSLQTGPQAREADRPPSGMRLSDWSSELRSFADTAALVEALDLVVTVDTAVAHLAGALGKPVWNLVKYHGCWRWLQQRNDSPWYPQMRLFRQREPEDWTVPIREAAARLRCLAEARRPPPGILRRLARRLGWAQEAAGP